MKFSNPSESFQKLNPQLFQTRISPAPASGDGGRGDLRRERDLHKQIAGYCALHDIIAFHGRMDRKTGRTIGENDFTCLLPDGRVLFVECKTETGKLSEAQEQLAAKMLALGHTLHVVRSLPEFIKLLVLA